MLRHLGAGVADCRVVELELLRRELYTVSLRLKSAGGRSVCVSSSRGVRVCTGVQVAIASSRRVSSCIRARVCVCVCGCMCVCLSRNNSETVEGAVEGAVPRPVRLRGGCLSMEERSDHM